MSFNIYYIDKNKYLLESWMMTVCSGLDYYKFPTSQDYAESSLIKRVSQLNTEELSHGLNSKFETGRGIENNHNFLIPERAMKYKVQMCQAFEEEMLRSTV